MNLVKVKGIWPKVLLAGLSFYCCACGRGPNAAPNTFEYYMQLVTFATDNGFGLQQGRPTSNVRVAETARDHKTVEQVAHPFLQIGFNSKTLPLSPRDIAQSLQLRKRINDQSWKRKGNHCKGPVAVGGIQLQLLCLSYSWLLRRLQHKLQW